MLARNDASRRPGAWLVLGAALAAAAGVVRAAPPISAEEEVWLLMGQGSDLARASIAAGADFQPFAYVMRPDGSVQRLVPAGHDQGPPADQLVAALEAGLRGQAASGALRASAVFVDVVVARAAAESEALQARLEHVSGYCVDVFLLYQRTPEGETRFDEPITRAREGTVFPGCGERAAPGADGYPPGAEVAPETGDESR